MPTKEVIDPQWLLERLLHHLAQVGPSNATDLCRHLRISQPTFSRLVGTAHETIIRTGRGRQTRYARRRPGPGGSRSVPLLIVDDTGRRHHAATLHPMAPQGFYLETHTDLYRSRIYRAWPYVLEDLRPSGFLGRLVPRLYPELGAPDDITRWTDDHCLLYLTRHGGDLTGNAIVGEGPMEPPCVVPDNDRAAIYPQLAERVLAHGIPGSSAAGEQPKFLAARATDRGQTPVLVKFSPQVTDALGCRVADLLVCEHIAHGVMQECGRPAPRSCLLHSAGRYFLEVERFDRTAAGGRRGIISLRALDLEFVGRLTSWSDTAQALWQQQRIPQSDYEAIVWLEAFGRLIGNVDRHLGNLSFYCDGERLLGLAPVYDMLPMLYAPQQNQLVARHFAPDPARAVELPVWDTTMTAARRFWTLVQEHPEISSAFKSLTIANAARLR